MTAPNERRTREPNEGWHLDKKVPISIILVLVMQAVAGVMAFAELRGRVALIEASHVDNRSQQHDRDERQDLENREAIALLRQQLSNMDGKLDRLIERAQR